MARSIVRLALIGVGTVAYLGLAVLGRGGAAAFFSHTPLVALAIALFVMAGVSVFAGGNLSSGVREDRGNRWVLAVFGVIGLLDVFVPAWTDRLDFWTIDGDAVRWLGVVLFSIGGVLRLWPVFVLGDRFSGLVAIQPGHTLVTSGIFGVIRNPSCSTRWAGAWRFAPESACCWRPSSSRRSSRASARRRRCSTPSSAPNTMPTAPEPTD
jgi:protein-S-isoprenylcysteine O-methyltransferase Ste14